MLRSACFLSVFFLAACAANAPVERDSDFVTTATITREQYLTLPAMEQTLHPEEYPAECPGFQHNMAAAEEKTGRLFRIHPL